MFEVLKKIAKAFNQASIKWCLGGSLVLYYFDQIEEVHDIDIIVDEKDYEKARSILISVGEARPTPTSDIFLTTHFSKYLVNGVKIDLIAGFKIQSSSGIYSYILDDLAISKTVNLQGVIIPLARLEDWYVLYHLMSKREDKIAIVEKYLSINQYNEALFIRALQQALPEETIIAIHKLLKK